MNDKFAEIVFASSFEVGMATMLTGMLEEAGYATRAHATKLYSYQGGAHIPADDWEFERPADWSTGGGVVWVKGETEYHAHPGDVLVLCGVEDRYGYAEARGLRVVRLCPEWVNVPGQKGHKEVTASDKPKPVVAYQQLRNWIDNGVEPEPELEPTQ